jgi:Undecaprenyl-phosphate glucose phosphotransferase
MTEFVTRAELDKPAQSRPVKTWNERESGLSDNARQIAQRFAKRSVSLALVSGIARGIDLLIVLATGYILSQGHGLQRDAMDIHHLLPLVSGSLLAIALFHIADGYNFDSFSRPFAQIERIAIAWTLVFACFAVLTLFPPHNPVEFRVWLLSWYFAGLASLVLFRVGLTFAVRQGIRHGRLQRRAVVIGGGEAAVELIEAISNAPDSDIRVCGLFDDRAQERSHLKIQGPPRLGSVAELIEFARIAKIDMLIVSLPLTAEDRLIAIFRQLWILPIDIRLSAYASRLRFRPRSYSFIGSVPLLNIFDKPISDWDSLGKRIFDLTIAGAALLLLSPLLFATAVAIKLESRGPVLFRQKRYGFNNEIIDVYKFRSMYADKCDYHSKVAVTKGDPRVTKVGRFIRKTSLDELPQLFNVIAGSLSLVGPRPHAIGSNTNDMLWEAVVDGYFARHKVKPGVTGWAQINGWRGEVDRPEKLQKRVEHDLYYVENWSPLLDLYILLRTPFALLNTKDAY